MNHIHRIRHTLASLTRRAGFLSPATGRARRGGRHTARAPLDHAPVAACPGPRDRHIRAAGRRAAARAAGKAADKSHARLAAAHHPTVHPLRGEPGRVLGQPRRRQTMRRRHWCLSCYEGLDRDRRDIIPFDR